MFSSYRAINLKRAIILTFMTLIIMIMAAGCKDNGEEEGITTDFLEDTVVTVGTARVSLAEWYLYALPKVSAATTMYGKNIWKYKISDDEGTMADAVRQDILNQIIYVKIVCSRAEQLGISLNEDELSDIETETFNYMNTLTSKQKSDYGITEKVVRSVYCDNLLAMKVYENLTLNIDTNIPDEEVRHMIIEYICANKTYENGDNGTERFSDEELAEMKDAVENLYQTAVSTPEIEKLSQLENEKYAAIEMITDYAGLREKFPADLADKVFNMREGEIAGPFDTEDAFFVFDCVKRNDEESTNKAKVEIIERRQRELFDQEYKKWEEEIVTKVNYSVWDGITIAE
ncbi:MAG: hypothetical protein K6E85_10805 [Lachnospiraceae bacterium]|nr:hypothetical protein [Lachnospiraceae bacterium]